MASNTESSTTEIDLRVTCMIVEDGNMGDGQAARGRSPYVGLLLFTGLAGVLFYGVLSLVPPQYRAEAQLHVAQAGVPAVRLVNREIGVLKSMPFKNAFIAGQHLSNDSEYNGMLAPKGPLLQVAQHLGLTRDLSVLPLDGRLLAGMERSFVISPGKDGIIQIAVRSTDAQKAARLANAYAAAYLDRTRAANEMRSKPVRAKGSDGHEALAALTKKRDEDRRAVAQLRQDISAHPFEKMQPASQKADEAKSEEASPLSGNIRLDKEQMFELTSQYILARADRKSLEMKAKMVEDMLKKPDGIEGLSSVLDSGPIVSLLERRRNMQKKLHDLNITLLPSHPQLRRVNRDMKALQLEIRMEAQKALDDLKDQIRLALERETSLKQSLEKLGKASVKDVAIRSAGLQEGKPVTPSVDPRLAQLAALEEKLAGDEQKLALLRAEGGKQEKAALSPVALLRASLVQPATAATQPVFPRKFPMTLLGMLAAFALGLLTLSISARREKSVGAQRESESMKQSAAPAHSVAHEQMPV